MGKIEKQPFLFIKVWRCTGKHGWKKQIETTQALGLSVSYSHVMKVKQAIARAVCRRYAEDGVVLPTNLRSDAFVTYDVDNLDGQNKGNFSQDEFHGTALSATNHLSWDNFGKKWDPIQIDLTGSSTPKLPDLYAVVPPVQLEERTTLFAPLSGNRPVRPLHDLVHGAKVKDESWLKYVSSLLQCNNPGVLVAPVWLSHVCLTGFEVLWERLGVCDGLAMIGDIFVW